MFATQPVVSAVGATVPFVSYATNSIVVVPETEPLVPTTVTISATVLLMLTYATPFVKSAAVRL